MTQRYLPSKFKKTADFGTVVSKENAAGVNVSVFSKLFTLHFFQKNKTITQKYLAVNTNYENTIILVVRHDSRLENCTHCKFNSILYTIEDYSPDDTDYSSYDLITIKKTSKVGAS